MKGIPPSRDRAGLRTEWADISHGLGVFEWVGCLVRWCFGGNLVVLSEGEGREGMIALGRERLATVDNGGNSRPAVVERHAHHLVGLCFHLDTGRAERRRPTFKSSKSLLGPKCRFIKQVYLICALCEFKFYVS
jgi:hypothetical protein